MMHKAWSSIVEVPYCFSRSYVKFQGHMALKIVEFDPNWAFPDCNSSLNSPMAMKCCTNLEKAMERCPIVFQGHPLNLKVTRYKTSLILTQIGRFRTIGRSQLSNPSDLPCFSEIQGRAGWIYSCSRYVVSWTPSQYNIKTISTIMTVFVMRNRSMVVGQRDLPPPYQPPPPPPSTTHHPLPTPTPHPWPR